MPKQGMILLLKSGLDLMRKTCDVSKYGGMGFGLKPYPITSQALNFYNDKININHGVNCVVDKIVLIGPIVENLSLTMKFLIRLIQSRGNVKWDGITLILDSPGGLIEEAIKIGDVLATTENFCNSFHFRINATAHVYWY